MSRPRRVVAIGGGHGLAATLEAVRSWGADTTAIVTVADDGGSSGRLRSDLGIIAPGDLRRCLEALAPAGLLNDAIGHRFGTGLFEGHPPGNILLAGLLQRADDPVRAIDTLAAAMGVDGRVLPSSLTPVDLVADTAVGTVSGQVAVSETSGIRGVRWEPPGPRSPAEAKEALAEADLIVLGPGSLYTSVLAAVVPDVRDAIRRSAARVLYVANLATQDGETKGYDVSDHVAALIRHGVEPDGVLVDTDTTVGSVQATVEVIATPLRIHGEGRHDPDLLSGALERYAAVTVSRSQDSVPYQEPRPR